MTMRRVSCPVIAGESTKSPLTRHMSLGTVFIRVSSASAATAGIAPFVVEVGPLETLCNYADADPPSALQGISINATRAPLLTRLTESLVGSLTMTDSIRATLAKAVYRVELRAHDQ